LQFSSKSRALFHHPFRPARPTLTPVHRPMFDGHYLFDLFPLLLLVIRSIVPLVPVSPLLCSLVPLCSRSLGPCFFRSLAPCSAGVLARTSLVPCFLAPRLRFTTHDSLLHSFTSSLAHFFTHSLLHPLLCFSVPWSLFPGPCFLPHPHASGTHPPVLPHPTPLPVL
jgi:hypothetical protein